MSSHIISPNGTPTTTSQSPYVYDVTEEKFVENVIEKSQANPVIVSFWSQNSTVCSQLNTELQKNIIETNGKLILAKVDVHTNQSLMAQLEQLGLPIDSVPLVVAFWKGQIHDILQKTENKKDICSFIEKIITKSGQTLPTETLIKKANNALLKDDFSEATNFYAYVLEEEAENPIAWGGLIRAMLAMNDLEGAEEANKQAPQSQAQHPDLINARAALTLYSDGQKAIKSFDTLDKNTISHALALNSKGQKEEAASILLEIISIHTDHKREEAKKELFRFFNAWGNIHPVTLQTRRKLSSLLFV